MITFGYKSRYSSLLRALACAAIGLVMMFGSDAATLVVKIIATFLIASGIVSVIYGYLHRDKGSLPIMSVNAVVDLVIGVILFCVPNLVAGFIVALIGIVLIIFGVLQLVVMGSLVRLQRGGAYSLILPAVAVLGGLLLIADPFSIRVMGFIAGSLLLLYGVSEVLSCIRVEKARRAAEEEAKVSSANSGPMASSLDNVKDVEYHKVDE